MHFCIITIKIYLQNIFLQQVEEKRENVSFVSRKCKFREVSEQYCQTFPNADYICRNSRPATRQYILNKVTCRQQKTVQFCMNIPE